MDERRHGNLFQVSEATDEKDLDLVIAVLYVREWILNPLNIPHF